jgi:hypothetical protein
MNQIVWKKCSPAPLEVENPNEYFDKVLAQISSANGNENIINRSASKSTF